MSDTIAGLRAEIVQLTHDYILGRISLNVYRNRIGVRFALIHKLEDEQMGKAS